MGSTTSHKSKINSVLDILSLRYSVSQVASHVLYAVRYKDLLLRGEIWTEVMDLGVTLHIRVFRCIWKLFTLNIQPYIVSGMSRPETTYGRKADPEGICTEYQL